MNFSNMEIFFYTTCASLLYHLKKILVVNAPSSPLNRRSTVLLQL